MTSCFINASTSIHPAGEAGADGICRAVEPDYKELVADPNLRRRMSRIVKMGVACGLDCLRQAGNPPVDAIITATGLGCLQDTEKFLDALVDREEQMLNPTPFIQSTFNVIGAQIALLTGNNAYNNTFVHRGLSFESALLDGMMQVAEGCSHVLVGTADEATPTARRLQQLACPDCSFAMGEGAAFFLLSGERTAATDAQLLAVRTCTGKFVPGQMTARLLALLHEYGLSPADVKLFITGGNDAFEADMDRLFPLGTQRHAFKGTCGEYPTASAFGLWEALSLVPACAAGGHLLLYNHDRQGNHAFLLLKGDGCTWT